MGRRIKHRDPWRLAVATGAAVALVTSGFASLVQPASASGFTLTVVASGGSTSGWTHSGGVLQATANVSINSSEIVSRLATSDLVVFAGKLVINSSVDASGALSTSDLTFRSLGNINVAGGVSIITNGGDITFQSASASNNGTGNGSIRLGAYNDSNTGVIDSNGGDILLSGGQNPALNSALASSDISTTKPAAGVAAYGFHIQAGGGNIAIRGDNDGTAGVTSRGVLLEGNAAGRSEINTTGSGEILLVGNGSRIPGTNPWGFAINGLDLESTSGQIRTIGIGGAGGNSRGAAFFNMGIASVSGDISMDDQTDGSDVDYTGSVFGNVDISTSGNVSIRTDEYVQDSAAVTLGAPNVQIQPFTGNSFTGPLVVGLLNASSSQNLRIGLEGNTSDVTINQALSVAGDAQIYGGKVIVDAALSSSGDIVIATSSGDIEVKDPISSTKATGDTIRLFANKPAPIGNDGPSTAGNVKLSGTGRFTVESGARALIYSGEATASTGLVDEVGGSGNSRGFVGATSVLANVSPSLTASGKFALFRSVTGGTPPTITAASAPGAPTVIAGAGVGVVDLEWVASTGTSEISYRVQSSPPGATCVVTGVTAVCSGLELGIEYSFTVIASNEGGSTSSSSSAGITLVAPTAPSAPGTPIATPGNGAVDLAWTAPTSGTAPLSYTLTSIPSLPAGASCTISGTSASCSGLTNGTQYSFIVSASNTAGSEDSVTSSAVTPLAGSSGSAPSPAVLTPRPAVLTPPRTPLREEVDISNAKADALRVEIGFTGPETSQPASYNVQVSPGGGTCSVNSAKGFCDIPGVRKGVEYSISVTAVNSLGSSKPSVVYNRVLLGSSGWLTFSKGASLENFAGNSPKVTRQIRTTAIALARNNPQFEYVTCTGFAAGNVASERQFDLALTRAKRICNQLKKVNPELETSVISRVPGSAFTGANRRVLVTGYTPID